MKIVPSLPAALLAALALALAPVPAAAQSAPSPAGGDEVEYPPVYRVEIIVFRHADGASDRRPAESPADHTGLMDPLVVARAHRVADRALAELAGRIVVVARPGAVDDSTPYLQAASGAGEETVRPIPAVYAALDGLSPGMARAMRRLEEAPSFEPIASRGWFQLAEQGRATATLRMHDRVVVDRIEPEAARRPPFFPELELPRFEVPAGVPAGQAGFRPRLRFEPLFSPPPPPQNVYRLDGRVRLRRRQFLHLDFELVWQTPPGDDPRSGGQGAPASPGPAPRDRPDRTRAAPEGWQMHRLSQSRVVEPGRLEYFDSSLFGVLALVTRFEQVVPEVEEAPTDSTEPGSGTGPESGNGDPTPATPGAAASRERSGTR